MLSHVNEPIDLNAVNSGIEGKYWVLITGKLLRLRACKRKSCAFSKFLRIRSRNDLHNMYERNLSISSKSSLDFQFITKTKCCGMPYELQFYENVVVQVPEKGGGAVREWKHENLFLPPLKTVFYLLQLKVFEEEKKTLLYNCEEIFKIRTE